MWHEPHAVPIRNGGSIEPSARRLKLLSLLFGSLDELAAKPSQLARLPLSLSHRALSKRGLGNLRKPSAPVDVPNARSHDDWRWSLTLVMRVGGVDRSILEVAGRITVPVAADVLQQLVVARAPVEAVGVVETPGRTAGAAGNAATGIVDDAPGGEAIVALLRIQHAVPVDQHADALLKDVGVEARVAGGGLVPDLTTRSLRVVQVRLARIEARVVRSGLACCRAEGGGGAACANISGRWGEVDPPLTTMAGPNSRNARIQAKRFFMSLSFPVDAE